MRARPAPLPRLMAARTPLWLESTLAAVTDAATLQAHLSGGEWVELLEPEHPGIAEVKWCRNRFRPFLCIAPQVCAPRLALADGLKGPQSDFDMISQTRYRLVACLASPESQNVEQVPLPMGRQATVVTGVQKDDAPGQRDAEEFIEVHRFDVDELRRMLTSCDMLVPSMTTSFLAFNRLASMRLL